ncbi:MAG: phage tail protein [Thioalkalivibrio sp.]
MRKLQMLRDHIVDALPEFKVSPERLFTYVEGGSIRFYRGANLAHEYKAPATISIADFSGDPDALIIPVLDWLARYQPDLDPERGVQFEMEYLSNTSADLSLTVELTERVVTSRDCETGRIEVDHRVPEFPSGDCPPLKWELYVRQPGAEEASLVASWDSPEPA